MSCCSHCVGAGKLFGTRQARRELRRFRERGPSRTTRQLLTAIRSRGAVTGATVLDIGGGVGAVPISMLESGAASAVGVDASPAYVEVASEELERRGLRHRADLRFGDFVALAEEVPDADVVTLDRAICCYPDADALVGKSAGKARRLWGAVYPRDRWWVRTGLAVLNGFMVLARNPFRVFAHPPEQVEAVLESAGLRRVHRSTTFIWQVVLFERD